MPTAISLHSSVTEILQLDGHSHSCDFTETPSADLPLQPAKIWQRSDVRSRDFETFVHNAVKTEGRLTQSMSRPDPVPRRAAKWDA